MLSNRLTFPGCRFALAAIPRPPTSAAPRSVKMSPNMLLVTTVSYCSGCVITNMHAASMYWCSRVTSGYSAPTSANVRVHSSMARMAFALVSSVSFFRLPRARQVSNAWRITRSVPFRVNRISCVATSSGVPFLNWPHMPA